MIKRIFLFVVVSGAFVFAGELLIIEKPSELFFYDQYESGVEKKDSEFPIPPYAPLFVEEWNTTLGDGITEVACVSFLGNSYYLSTQDGEITGIKNAGKVLKLKNIKIFKKSGILKKRVPFYSTPAGGKILFRGSSDTKLLSAYKYGGYIFLYSNDLKVYGWVRSHDAVWVSSSGEYDLGTSEEESSIEYIAKLTDPVVDYVNELYAKSFDYFNKRFNKDLTAPSWGKSVDGNILVYKLNARHGYASNLEKSSDILLQKLRKILISENYTVELVERRKFLIRKGNFHE